MKQSTNQTNQLEELSKQFDDAQKQIQRHLETDKENDQEKLALRTQLELLTLDNEKLKKGNTAINEELIELKRQFSVFQAERESKDKVVLGIEQQVESWKLKFEN